MFFQVLFWFMNTIMTRFLKLIGSSFGRLCLMMEVVGCPVFGTLIHHIYSQTCIKRSSLRQGERCLIRQVAS
jgi:hypothetical protein